AVHRRRLTWADATTPIRERFDRGRREGRLPLALSSPTRPTPLRRPLPPLLVGVVALSIVGPAEARTRLRSRSIDDFLIVYPGSRFEYLMPHIEASLENSLAFHRELYG